jgi:hypothetical protein
LQPFVTDRYQQKAVIYSYKVMFATKIEAGEPVPA